VNVTVWTDGSGTTGGPAGIGYAAIADEIDGTILGSLPLRNATNQQAEILAVALALHELPERSTVTVVSDSEYVVLGWNDPRRLPLWKTNGWRKASGSPVANVAHWQRLLRAAERHEAVTVEWTRGHVGTDGNERADRLAGQARATALADALP
jgi:ribonuclease HI